MSVIVQKYGGSSVADVGRLEGVADKVVATRQAGHDVVVVVSAMGKTTDQLLSLAHQVDASPPRRELDMLLTTGERVSMALLSMAIQKRGCDAISFTGSQSGIITNDRHFDARIIEVRPFRIEDELARGKVVIVAGYQGMSYRREITALGRGGSDTTAIALAAALSAERAEIYSDVDGVYSADPRVVPDAKHLPELSYEHMQEMAEAGAKVLHAAAVEIARRSKIAIHARSTFQPGRETVVREEGDASGIAVVGRRALVEIDCGEGLEAAIDLASAAGLKVVDTMWSGGRGRLTLSSDAPDWPGARARLEASGATIVEGLGAVAVVGPRVSEDPTFFARAMDALGASGCAPREVASAPLRLSVRLASDEVEGAVRALHAALA